MKLLYSLSHPLRVRGLKLVDVVFVVIVYLSHPLRVRGLKQRGPEVTVPINGRILYGCVD